jgi:release factor glutamine methyltransferase
MIRVCLPRVPEALWRRSLRVPARVCPNVEECLASGRVLLERAGIGTARLDAECLLSHVLGWPRWRLVTEQGRRLTQDEFGRYLTLLQRREQREPLAYLLGTREFWSLPLAVSSGVLIPRPETETLVEAALAILREACPQGRTPTLAKSGGGPPVILDLCTGAGAVAIALAWELPGAAILATDVSRRAIRIARRNAETHGVADRVTFLRGDLWHALNGYAMDHQADLIVSNPPYILGGHPGAHAGGAMGAAAGPGRGPDGLRFHRRIISHARGISGRGFLLLEIGQTRPPR